MPVPCSPIGSLEYLTSAPFSRSPEIAYYASAVSSRLSSLAAFLANRTQLRASDSPEPTTATSGPNASECFGSFDPALPSSRMFPGSSQASPLPRMVTHAKDFFSTGFCQTWPKSGLLVRGKLYQQQTLAQLLARDHPISERASGSSALTNWPTSRAADGESAGMRVSRGVADTLTAKVRETENWPTASARDWKDTPGMALDGVNPDGSHRDRTDLLPRKVYEMERSGPPPTASGPPDPGKRSTSGSPAGSWATPRTITGGAESAKRKQELGRTESGGGDLQSQVQGSGKLNPSWVETLMGLPLGWTQLPRKFVKPRATP